MIGKLRQQEGTHTHTGESSHNRGAPSAVVVRSPSGGVGARFELVRVPFHAREMPDAVPEKVALLVELRRHVPLMRGNVYGCSIKGGKW